MMMRHHYANCRFNASFEQVAALADAGQVDAIAAFSTCIKCDEPVVLASLGCLPEPGHALIVTNDKRLLYACAMVVWGCDMLADMGTL